MSKVPNPSDVHPSLPYRRRGKPGRGLVPFFACVAPALILCGAVTGPWFQRSGAHDASLSPSMFADCTRNGSCGGDPSGTAPHELVTVIQYGVFGVSYVCVNPSGSTCEFKLGSLDGFIGNFSGTYTLKALDPNPNWVFNHWISNAGTFGSPNSVQTTFTVGGAGYLSFVVNSTSASAWAGYATGMVGNGSNPMRITSAEGTFTIPSPSWIACGVGYCGTLQLTETLGIWVGLGAGLSSNSIWQAGVDVQISPNGIGGYTTLVNPWYEFYTDQNSKPTYLRNWIQPSIGDKLRVVVWNNNSQSSYYFQDLTNHQVYGGTISGTPPSDSAEWVAEDENMGSVVMPSFSNFLFVNPVVAASCSGGACSFGNTWLLPLEEKWIHATHQTGSSTYVTQSIYPSRLYSNLTEFVDTYS
jgi:hypothetical protein